MNEAPSAACDEPDVSDLMASYSGLADGPCDIPDAINDPDWVRSSGKTPLEFLTAVYRHPLVQMRDRISAAKTVVEYTHKKMPSAVELSGTNGGSIKVTGAMLAGLSDAELGNLEALLMKANASAEVQR